MRRTWVIIAAIVIAVPIVFVVALMLIPDSVYRDRISAAVKDATGRELSIGGKIGISIFPTLGVSAENVALSNAEGFTAASFASMKSLQAGVALFPLLQGKVEITRFSLIEPTIALEVDAQGHNNWTFHGKNAPAGAAPQQPAQTGGPGGGLGELSLGKVELVDGQVSYANRQTNASWNVTAINVTLALPSLDQPFSLDGKANWKGKPVSLTLTAQNPRQILNGVPAPVTLKVDSDLLKASFDGNAAAGADTRLSGKADLSVTSVRDLSAWLSKPMAAGQGFGPLAIKGDLAYQTGELDFSNASVNFDKIDGTGQVQIKTGGSRPFVKAQLAVGTLDLNPYMGASAQGGGGAAGGAGGGGGAPAAGGGWSTERLDFSGLKAIDADFAFQAKTILVKKMTFTDSVLATSLRDGVLTADLTKVQLYGGSGKAKIVLDGSGGTPGLATDLAFSGINIQPFLKDGANFDRLSGTGNLTLSVRGQGASQKALAQSLSGSGALNLVNGAIRGFNLAAMVRNVSGAFAGAAGGGEQKTDFASLAGTWTIASGVLSNNDMALLNPLLRVAGAGTADIGNRTVNYLITPKGVSDLTGQGGKSDVTGISVPIRVTGPWDNLRFAPDPKGLLEGALKGAAAAQGAGQNPLKGALKGLLGQPGAKNTAPAQAGTGAAPPPAKKEKPAEKLLKGLLGQ
jgi:AsmA protein